MRPARTPPARPRGLGGGRGAARPTANFPPIEDAKANFFGAHGNVVSGATSLSPGDGIETLLELEKANIVVSAAVDAGNAVAVTVHNGTGVPLRGTQDVDGAVTQVSLAAGAGTEIRLSDEHVHRLHLQIFPNRPQFPDVVTLLVSSEYGAIVGQAFVSAIQ